MAEFDNLKENITERKSDPAWWHDGLNLFFKLWFWLTAPIVIALFLNEYFAKKYQTDSWIFFVLVALAFLITIGAISKETIDYLHAKAKEEEKEKNDGKKF